MSFLIENKIKTFRYILVWLVYACCHVFSLYWLVEIPLVTLCIDALIHSVLFIVFGILLWNVLFYGNYNKIPAIQRIINYSALAFLVIGLWLILGYGLDYLCLGEESARKFIPFLPIYALLGLLLFLINVFYFQNKISEIRLLNENQEEINPLSLEEDDIETVLETEILERIAVKSGHKIHVILVPDIIYLQADGDYVMIHTSNGKYLKEQTMKYFQANLPQTQFVRVHRSYIVHIESISRIEQYEKQNQLLTLKNGDKIKVSIAGYKLLKSRLGL